MARQECWKRREGAAIQCAICPNRCREGRIRNTKNSWFRGEDTHIFVCNVCVNRLMDGAMDDILDKAVETKP